ncbi:hypothetical protein QR680_012375 [Steinernema hermaphroditum]|uniref:Telomere length regulation protein conserved domain-containing protein n=1 Tax=Steinernema hermaphroditum TaxID=289476 RepID=A0AA39I447_9BILA|nr:hypothetical protein QR680_012375 [Steinernema hermaphroditum]
MDFDARIRSARERGNILAILSDIGMELKSPGAHDKLVDVLCSSALVPSFVGQLTATEFESHFAVLFTSGALSVVFTLARLVSRLSEADLTPFAFERLLLLLELVEKPLLLRFLASDHDSEEAHQLTSMLCSLPERIGNFVGKQKMNRSDALKAVKSHWENTFGALTETLTKGHCSQIQALFLVKIGLQNEEAFERLVSWFYHSKNPLLFSELLLHRSAADRREAEQILIRLATLSCTSSELLDKLLGDSIKNNEIVRKLYLEKLHVQRLLPQRVSDKLAIFAQKHGVAREGFLTLLRIWADQAKMICLVDVVYQIQLSKAVLDFGKIVFKSSTEEEREEISMLVKSSLLSAMSDFLNVSEVFRRQMGMFVAEALCSWFSTTPLAFDYDDEDDLLQELRAIVAEEGERPVQQITKTMEMTHIALLENSGERNLQLDSDDEEEFEVFNTEETPREARTDLTTEKSPSLSMFYIRDCLEALDDEKDPTRFRIGMHSLEALILRRAVGFDDLALKIAEKMVFIHDIFRIPNFEDTRIRILKACMVMRPDVASPLIRILYSRNVTHQQRYLILEVIDGAVETLKEQGKVNREPQTVTAIIYSLMDFDNSMQHLNFYDEDYALLAKIYFIIGKFIRVLGKLPCCVRVSRSVALSLRFVRNHPRFHVLQSALLCYSAILEAIPKEVLVAQMPEELREWADFLVHLLDHDQRPKNDTVTKKIAGAVLVQLTGIVEK